MNLGKIVLWIGIVSLILAILSRLMMKPLPPVGIEAGAMVRFASSCFLLAIALSIVPCKK